MDTNAHGSADPAPLRTALQSWLALMLSTQLALVERLHVCCCRACQWRAAALSSYTADALAVIVAGMAAKGSYSHTWQFRSSLSGPSAKQLMPLPDEDDCLRGGSLATLTSLLQNKGRPGSPLKTQYGGPRPMTSGAVMERPGTQAGRAQSPLKGAARPGWLGAPQQRPATSGGCLSLPSRQAKLALEPPAGVHGAQPLYMPMWCCSRLNLWSQPRQQWRGAWPLSLL